LSDNQHKRLVEVYFCGLIKDMIDWIKHTIYWRWRPLRIDYSILGGLL